MREDFRHPDEGAEDSSANAEGTAVQRQQQGYKATTKGRFHKPHYSSAAGSTGERMYN